MRVTVKVGSCCAGFGVSEVGVGEAGNLFL